MKNRKRELNKNMKIFGQKN